MNWKKHPHPDPRKAASDLPPSSQCKTSVNTPTTKCNYTSPHPLHKRATAPAPGAAEQIQLTPLFAPDRKNTVITISAQRVATNDSLTKRVGYGLWVMGSSGGVVEGVRGEKGSARAANDDGNKEETHDTAVNPREQASPGTSRGLAGRAWRTSPLPGDSRRPAISRRAPGPGAAGSTARSRTTLKAQLMPVTSRI